MNKRGFLLGEETVKIILAVIALVFLVAFIVYLYLNYSQNKDLQYAQSSLDYLISGIKSGSTQIEIYNPSAPWFLASFSQNLPVKCSSVGWTGCICICKAESVAASGGPTPSELCNNYGVCAQEDFSVIPPTGIIINPPLTLSVNQQTKTIQKGN